jgi:hypothetical protein
MKQKTVYLAGKIDSGESDLASFSAELEDRGHIVLEKWWEKDAMNTPYLDYPAESAKGAQAMIDAAIQSDVFILFPSNTILGAAVELGAAIASTKNDSEKLVLINYSDELRQSVFYTHPSALAVNSLDQIRTMDWY